ncbi:motility associated factor glycosyltransferase family protein [Brucepastera parasyntrophica]|uniref:motility associated factor glycosyltransferase family protein n=1 Tax=Brucepastera parasyntrophica TaxID=2880008 RepID=UPI003F6F4ABC
MRDCDGIHHFSSLFPDTPVLVLAAGPSLDYILPFLPEISKRCVIIAVDTALRACLKSGINPDFIILVDPQYWNWRHLAGLSSPGSILITESAAWPAVFRFQCRRIYLCSSLFPLGKFIESRIGKKGELGAGGSVATSAWDFARFLGAKTIYMAGLDLGYPEKKTHFRGSTFEEQTHTVSGRTTPAETASIRTLYSAGPYEVPDYTGGTVLTDKRLMLYSWWFENRLAAYPENKTVTLSPDGVKIPGFTVAGYAELLQLPVCRDRITSKVETVLGTEFVPDMESFDNTIRELKNALEDIKELAAKAANLCSECGPEGSGRSYASVFAELDAIDRKIMQHPAKEIAAMVFQSVADETNGKDENKENPSGKAGVIARSKKLYTGIVAAADRNLTLLAKFD